MVFCRPRPTVLVAAPSEMAPRSCLIVMSMTPSSVSALSILASPSSLASLRIWSSVRRSCRPTSAPFSSTDWAVAWDSKRITSLLAAVRELAAFTTPCRPAITGSEVVHACVAFVAK